LSHGWGVKRPGSAWFISRAAVCIVCLEVKRREMWVSVWIRLEAVVEEIGLGVLPPKDEPITPWPS